MELKKEFISNKNIRNYYSKEYFQEIQKNKEKVKEILR